MKQTHLCLALGLAMTARIAVADALVIEGDLTVTNDLAVLGRATVRGKEVLLADGSVPIASNLVVNGELIASAFRAADNNTSGTGNSAVGGTGNVATGFYSTVSGGFANTAGSVIPEWPGWYSYDVVAGGYGNQATGGASTVSGGWENKATGWGAVIGGGRDNAAEGYASAVLSGENNASRSVSSVIAGGRLNVVDGSGASWTYEDSFIGGGCGNTVASNARSSVIVGGAYNRATEAAYQVAIGGGGANRASGFCAVISGGQLNEAASGAAVGGGIGNKATGVMSTIPGGLQNTASGSYSFAAGWRASATNDNSFVWSDGTETFSTQAKQFTVYASSGTRLLGGPTQVADPVSSKDAVNLQSMQDYMDSSLFGVYLRADGMVPVEDNLSFSQSIGVGATSSDGADTEMLVLSGGGLTNTYDIADCSRGAGIWLCGNEQPIYSGDLYLCAGDTPEGRIHLTTGSYEYSLTIDPDGSSRFYGHRLKEVANPVAPTDAANRQYVDQAISAQQVVLEAMLQNVGPYGDISMGCYTNRP